MGIGLHVLTVDHGLRPEAAAEAEMVAETCAELGWEHQTLRWNWDGQGNLMDAARRARDCISSVALIKSSMGIGRCRIGGTATPLMCGAVVMTRRALLPHEQRLTAAS